MAFKHTARSAGFQATGVDESTFVPTVKRELTESRRVDRLCDGRFRRVPLPAVVDLLVRLADERDGGDEIGSRRHRALLESEHDERADGGAVVAINAQRNTNNGRRVEPPARPVA